MRFLLASVLLAGIAATCFADGPSVPVLRVSGSINPGTADYIISGIDEAEKQKAPFLVMVMDTPGGLLTSTRQIVQKMLNTSLPIVVWVGPRGARAGSAGALITFAADIAAMAPATNIGAAHPVPAGGEQMDKTMAEKLANDTAAFAESIAKTRGRNAQWAIKAVKDSASISADEALKVGVIDFLAEDEADLQRRLVGFRPKVPKGGVTELPAQVAFVQRPMSLKHKVVSFLADPNLAYMIMSLGALCLWIELSHPGLVLPGVVGVLCIIVSLVSFQLLPISYGALALILVGLAFIIAEIFLPTFGVLGVGGIAAFIVGSLFLMDTPTPEYQISLKLILPTAALLASSAAFIGYTVFKSQKRKHLSGLEALIGALGEVREATSEKGGKVFVEGELWNAVSHDGSEIPKGTIAVVKEVRRMELVIAEK